MLIRKHYRISLLCSFSFPEMLMNIPCPGTGDGCQVFLIAVSGLVTSPLTSCPRVYAHSGVAAGYREVRALGVEDPLGRFRPQIASCGPGSVQSRQWLPLPHCWEASLLCQAALPPAKKISVLTHGFSDSPLWEWLELENSMEAVSHTLKSCVTGNSIVEYFS